MARNSRDRQCLELHGGKWRVTVAVPRKLHPILGTRLKAPLGTDSLSEANRLKVGIVDDLRARIARELRGGGGVRQAPRAVVLEAMEIRKSLSAAGEGPASDDVLREMRRRGEEILGSEVRVVHDEDTGMAHPVHDPGRLALARQFVAVVTGRGTPFLAPHEKFMAQTYVKARTRQDDVRAIRYLTKWCEDNNVPATIEAITKRVAVAFGDDLVTLTGNLDPVTQNKYLRRLSRFWKYMLKREEVESNVWDGVKVELKPKLHSEQERAFTDDEVRILLIGGAPDKLMDLIKIAALTGARLDVVVDLKVKDAMDGAFTFKPQKKETAPRDIPIHPDLEELVARRVSGKHPTDDFFPEWPRPTKIGSVRERSFKASNAFTEYRRKVGVDERVAGKRRALVNFHSLRRWFITKAERAGNDGDLIAAIVGHKRSGMTLGRYSEGPEMEKARRCVASVRLPPLDQGPVKEQRALTPRKKVTAEA